MSIVVVSRVEEYSYEIIRNAIEQSIERIGGISSLVKRGDHILLKPNLLSAKPPERNITTHPILVEVIADILIENGCSVSIGDSPGGAYRGVKRVFDETGMTELAQRKGINLINFESSGACELCFNGYSLKISRAFLEFDKVINIPKLKTHILTMMTGAVKNIFGIVPGFAKTMYHKLYPFPDDFARFLVNLYMAVKQRIILNVIDGIVGMEGEGPSSGEAVRLGCVVVSTDAVAADYVCAKIMGYKDGAVRTTSIAKKLTARSFDNNIEIIGELPRFPRKLKLLSDWKYFLVPKFLARLIAPLVWIRPDVVEENCNSCRICAFNCPTKAISIQNGFPSFDYRKCITCLCCHELCPNKAIMLKRSFLARIVGK